MGTGSGRGPPPSNRTLPEIKSGLAVLSVVLGLRVELELVGGVLRDGVPVGPPVGAFDPLPRCAVAAAVNKTMTTSNRVMNRLEPSTIAASIQSQRDFQLETQKGKTWETPSMVRLSRSSEDKNSS